MNKYSTSGKIHDLFQEVMRDPDSLTKRKNLEEYLSRFKTSLEKRLTELNVSNVCIKYIESRTSICYPDPAIIISYDLSEETEKDILEAANYRGRWEAERHSYYNTFRKDIISNIIKSFCGDFYRTFETFYFEDSDEFHAYITPLFWDPIKTSLVYFLTVYKRLEESLRGARGEYFTKKTGWF